MYSQSNWSIPSSVGKCQTHQTNDYIYLCIDPNLIDIDFKCDICIVEDQSLIGNHLLLIKQIVESGPETIFYNWPLNSRNLLTELRETLSKQSSPKQKYLDNIAQFKYFKKNLIAKLDHIQQQMEQQIHSFHDYSQIISKYNTLSSKTCLKEEVLNSFQNFKEISIKIQEIIKKTTKNQHDFQQKIRKELDTLALQKKEIMSSHIQNNLQDDILQRLDRIERLFQSDSHHCRSQQSDEQEQKRESKQNIDIFQELISNKLNFTTSSFQEKLKSHLEDIQFIVNPLDFGIVYEQGYEKLDLEVLNEQEIQEVRRFIETLIKSKRAQKQNVSSKRQDERSLDISDIFKLVENQANFANKEMCQQVREMLENIQSYVKSFKVKSSTFSKEDQVLLFQELSQQNMSKLRELLSCFKFLMFQQEQLRDESMVNDLVYVASQIKKSVINVEDHQNWKLKYILRLTKNVTCNNNQQLKLLREIKFKLELLESSEKDRQSINQAELTEDQIISLQKLGDQMKIMNGQWKNEYAKQTSPDPFMQLLSYQVANKKFFLTETEKKDFNLLLSQYPIFEMMSFKQEYQIEWNFIKPNYGDSKELLISKTCKGVSIVQPFNSDSSSVTEQILDNDLVYSFKCKFNKHLVNCNSIRIGLIENSKLEKPVGDIPFSVYRSIERSGARELIKGNYLTDEALRKEYKELEFKFCISEQKFYYADLDHKNINKVESNLINKNGEYRFGVSFCVPGNNWSVTVSPVKIFRNTLLVDKFD